MRIPRFIVLEKERGQTPLEAIQIWKAAYPEFASLPASYAGRLDPMAEGKLLVLLGEECKRQSAYTKLDKEYVIEVLLGVGSDTGDVLGIVEAAAEPDRSRIQTALAQERGTHRIPYPAFSSKTVNGKPLFLYTLEGIQDSITIPEHDETIYRIELLKTRTYSTPELNTLITTALAVVPRSDAPSKALGADFRIDAVRASWDPVLQGTRTYTVLTLRVACASGTYMRSVAQRLGTALGTQGLALSIRRTRIGKRSSFLGRPYWRRL